MGRWPVPAVIGEGTLNEPRSALVCSPQHTHPSPPSLPTQILRDLETERAPSYSFDPT